MHENILLGVGFRGSHWSRFRSRFTKSMTSKNYNKLWNLTFRYKLFITYVCILMYVYDSVVISSLTPSYQSSFVRSFVCSCPLVRSLVRSCLFVRLFVRSCLLVRFFFRVHVCSFVCSCVRYHSFVYFWSVGSAFSYILIQ